MPAKQARRSARNPAAKPWTWRAVKRLVESAIVPGERNALLDRFNNANYAGMPARQLWALGTGPWHDVDVGGEPVQVRAIVKLGALTFFTILQVQHGGFVGEPNGQFYEMLAQQLNGTRSAARNGRQRKLSLLESAESLKRMIVSSVPAPYVDASVGTTDGVDRPFVSVTISLAPPRKWEGGTVDFSRHAWFWFDFNGRNGVNTAKQLKNRGTTRMPAFRFVTPAAALKHLLKWVDEQPR